MSGGIPKSAIGLRILSGRLHSGEFSLQRFFFCEATNAENTKCNNVAVSIYPLD